VAVVFMLPLQPGSALGGFARHVSHYSLVSLQTAQRFAVTLNSSSGLALLTADHFAQHRFR
jgi:hypothetical protein